MKMCCLLTNAALVENVSCMVSLQIEMQFGKKFYAILSRIMITLIDPMMTIVTL